MLQKERHDDDITLIYNTDILPELPADFFELSFWQNNDLITGHATGRGITWFMQYQSLSLVWRRYRRGGLIGKVLKQHFLNGRHNRAEQEFRLLLQLQQLELPAPTPVAARILHGRLCYQAEIITLRIPDAEDLVSRLKRTPLDASQWLAIGRMIARFHQHNVFHSDLNSHNILLDAAGNFWLIDFDKCAIRPDARSWKQANLARLKRSLEKEKSLHAGFCFHEQDWQTLVQGYQTGR